MSDEREVEYLTDDSHLLSLDRISLRVPPIASELAGFFSSSSSANRNVFCSCERMLFFPPCAVRVSLRQRERLADWSLKTVSYYIVTRNIFELLVDNIHSYITAKTKQK